MKKTILFLFFVVIIILVVLSVVLFNNSHLHSHPITSNRVTPMVKKMIAMPTEQVGVTFCDAKQLLATIAPQGAAGNVYATLEITNNGKTACSVMLGNNVTALYNANNITIRYQEQSPSISFLLAPSAKVYSQIHYPNGPQCQSAITPKVVTFFYKTDQLSIPFQSTTPGIEKIIVQACSSVTEKTQIDIWPVSKNPITP